MKGAPMPNINSSEFIRKYENELSSVPLPQKLAGNYTIASILKDTADKKIFRLCDSSGNDFILKSSGGILRTSLKQEYDILCQLDSPHFPEAVDFFEENGISYLLRSYVKGISLCDYAERLSEYHPQEADVEQLLLPLFLECCEIISTLHALTPPMIHRDIKGENFIYTHNCPHLVLIDVDAGHQFAPDKSRDTIFAGTYGNAAPEQFGFRQSDMRTDVYGLGKTFLTLLNASDADDPRLSPQLSVILRKAVSFEPKQRYNSVKELQHALAVLHTKRSSGAAPLHQKNKFIILLIGLLIGSMTGSGIGVICSQKFLAPAVSDQTVSSGEAAADRMDPPVASGSTNTSIVDRAGVQPLDLFDFQEDVDALLLAAYDSDADALSESVERLISRLYEEPELTRNPPEDYADYDTLPEYIQNCSAVDHIRLRLAYRDQCLKKTIGSYDQYQNDILSLLRIVLYRTSDADSSCIYKYSHSAADAVDENDYSFCLSDLLDNIQLAIDNHDGFVRAYEQN